MEFLRGIYAFMQVSRSSVSFATKLFVNQLRFLLAFILMKSFFFVVVVVFPFYYQIYTIFTYFVISQIYVLIFFFFCLIYYDLFIIFYVKEKTILPVCLSNIYIFSLFFHFFLSCRRGCARVCLSRLLATLNKYYNPKPVTSFHIVSIYFYSVAWRTINMQSQTKIKNNAKLKAPKQKSN